MSEGYTNAKLRVGDDPVATANPVPVEVVNVTTPVTLTGDLVVDTLGALNNSKVVNPDAASATLPALARGSLKQLVDILAKISADPATDTTLATLATEATAADILTVLGSKTDAAWNGSDASASAISILKKIALNTVPA